MELMSAVYMYLPVLLFSTPLFQLATSSPIGSGRWPRRVDPDPNQGAICERAPNLGEYCDKFSSGHIKRCSPCNGTQLGDSNISFPEECAEYVCPYRCPEEISDSNSPAPSDSCDVTTAALTTQETTTLAPSTSFENKDGSSTPTQEALSLTTSNYQSTKPSSTSALPPGNEVTGTYISVGVGVGVLMAIIIVIITVFCMRKYKYKCRNPVATSPSCEPMIAGSNEFALTPPQTPTSPDIIPGVTSVKITTQESNMFVKLDCNCGEDAIPVGPEGVTLHGLLPSTRYYIVLGTQEDNTTFHPKHHMVTETNDETHAVNRCNFSLHNLKTHIENNSRDFQRLKALFGHVDNEKGDLLRALSRVLKVASLADDAGSPLFEEMINTDSLMRAEEDSTKVYDIQRALTGHSQQVPDFVADIRQKLSSIHEDCLPCKHLVCEVTRTSIETVV